MREPVRSDTRIGEQKTPRLLPVIFELALAKVGVNQVQVTPAARS